jgi:acyl-CoA thioesterase
MTRFDRTTAVVHDGSLSTRAHAHLDESWSSLRGIHGGYLAAIATRASEPLLDGASIRTLSTTFFRPAMVGPVELELATRRAGRSLTTVDVAIVQAGREIALTRITAARPVANVSWDHAVAPDVPPRAQCEPLAPPEGVRHFEQAVGVLDAAFRPFSHGDRARVAGYVRPLEDRPIDVSWLAMILDWFPPSPFTRLDPPTGGVSVDFTVHVHRTIDVPLRAHEWLVGEFEAEVSRDGIALEKGRLAAADGTLLAESFHTRWTGQ